MTKMKEIKMKKLLIGLTLATIAATPVMAQSYYGGSNRDTASFRGQMHAAPMSPGYDSYAYAPGPAYQGYAAPEWSSPYSSFSGDEYVRTDPDPAIRLELRREQHNPS
jgi:hypothetical protein